MSASWTCLRCNTIIPAMMPAALVVRGQFSGTREDGRTFIPNDSTQDALCEHCLEAIKDEEVEPPSRETKCSECEGVILSEDTRMCQECFDKNKGVEEEPPEFRSVVLEAGIPVLV